MAFRGDGSGGGNMAPSLEPATVPVAVEVGDEDLVTEEDIVVIVEGRAFGEAVDVVVGGLRMIRGLGGMGGVVSREESDGGRNPFRLRRPTPTYATNSRPSSPLDALSAARWTLTLTTMSRLS